MKALLLTAVLAFLAPRAQAELLNGVEVIRSSGPTRENLISNHHEDTRLTKRENGGYKYSPWVPDLLRRLHFGRPISHTFNSASIPNCDCSSGLRLFFVALVTIRFKPGQTNGLLRRLPTDTRRRNVQSQLGRPVLAAE